MFGTRRLWCDETINWVDGIDDRYVAIRGHSNPFVYDHRTGELVTGIDPRSIPAGTAPLHPSLRADPRWSKVSPDGRWAAVGMLGSRLRIYDNTTGEMKFADDPQYGFDELALSLDGTQLAAIAGAAYVFAEDRPPRHLPDLRYGIAFDAAGDLIGGNVGKLARWSVDGTERSRVSVRHKIDSISISRDGRLASATTMIMGGLCMDGLPDVVVADLQRGRARLRFRDPGEITRRAVLSPDGRWLVLQDDGRARLMSAEARPPWSVPPIVRAWEGHSLVMAPDDRALLVDEASRARVIALPSGEPISEPTTLDGEIRASPDGSVYVEVTPDRRTVRVRDRSTLQILRERATELSIRTFEISSDGKRLAITDGPIIELVTL